MYVSIYRDQARDALRGNWFLAVLVCFLAGLFGAGNSGSVSIDMDNLEMVQEYLTPEMVKILTVLIRVLLFVSLFQFFLSGPIHLGYCTFLLNICDYQKASLGDLFSQMGNFLKGFLLPLLTGIFVFLWSLLFIFPGVMKAYSYAMAPYILAENPDMSPLEAIRQSKEMMQGNRFRLFTLQLSFIGWELLALLTCGIGSLFVNPYRDVAMANFYRDL